MRKGARGSAWQAKPAITGEKRIGVSRNPLAGTNNLLKVKK